MIRSIIKRDGSVEEFTPSKVNKWSIWSASTLGDRVDWSSIVLEAVRDAKEVISSQDLQWLLIKKCIEQKDWPHNLMGGRLYASHIRKQMYGDKVPTVKELFNKMQAIGLMKELNYTDEEYTAVESIIDHTRDFNLAYFQINQIRTKYSLQNRSTKEKYESTQFTFMRMAMALAEDEVGETKLIDVKGYYDEISLSRINPPSPNYINLGTKLNGYSSCCLYTVGDDSKSLAIGDHIAYTMTCMSAGIGGYLGIRSLGDPVRGGIIEHQGRLPYYTALAGAVKANIQAGRGGACTTYFTCFDPEVVTLIMLQNPRTPVAKQNRDMHFAIQYNRLFAKKVAKGENIFSFNSFTAPDLHKLFFTNEQDKFEALYNQYEQDVNFKKTYVSAREILHMARQQAYEISTLYEANMDEINRHTPFVEPIHSSNLCVAPETMILTDKGEVEIQTKVDQLVNVWNGHEYSEVTVKKTGTNQKLLKVKTDSGQVLECTPYHKFYILEESTNKEVETRASDLKVNDKLCKFALPTQDTTKLVRVLSVEDEGRISDTYCFNEPKRNRGVFNGILTGQCVEITEPTAAYYDMLDLYAEKDNGKIVFTDQTDKEITLSFSDKVFTQSQVTFAGNLKVGDTVGTSTVKSIQEVTPTSEVALCSLAALVACNIHTNEQWEKSAYYALKMIEKCIHLSDYPLPHVGWTAKNRLNAAVGILGVATHMARKKLSYSTQEGRNEIHKLSEKHAYFVIKASLTLGKEKGNAPWIHKTKWPQGWLPIDTYKKAVDSLVTVGYQFDWEVLRQEIIANGGIRNSSVIAHMPTESSSKASGVPNGWYPVRSLSMKKSDESNVLDWCAVDNDIIGEYYENAYTIPTMRMIEVYAIIQKFTDHTISADLYRDRSTPEKVQIPTSEMTQEFLHMVKHGVKTRYYQNSLTTEGQAKETTAKQELCSSGACDV